MRGCVHPASSYIMSQCVKADGTAATPTKRAPKLGPTDGPTKIRARVFARFLSEISSLYIYYYNLFACPSVSSPRGWSCAPCTTHVAAFFFFFFFATCGKPVEPPVPQWPRVHRATVLVLSTANHSTSSYISCITAVARSADRYVLAFGARSTPSVARFLWPKG